MHATICNDAGAFIKAHNLQEGDLLCFYKTSKGDYVRKTPTFDIVQDTYASLCQCYLLPHSINFHGAFIQFV